MFLSAFSGLNTEIIPDNLFSRVITLYVMLVGAIYIPTNLSELIFLIRSSSKFDGAFQLTRGQSHILLVGSFNATLLKSFFDEFFHSNHG